VFLSQYLQCFIKSLFVAPNVFQMMDGAMPRNSKFWPDGWLISIIFKQLQIMLSGEYCEGTCRSHKVHPEESEHMCGLGT